MKKSFILYIDQEEIIDQLTDERAGRILKALFDHARGEKPILPTTLLPIFISIRQAVDRSNIRYEARCEQNKKNIEKRWNKSKKVIRNEANKYETIRTDTKAYLKDKDKDKDINNITPEIGLDNRELPPTNENHVFNKKAVTPTASGLAPDFFDRAMDLAEKLSAKKVEQERRAK